MTSKITKWEYAHWLLFAVVLFLTRFLFLTERPLHHDETINGWFVIQMWREGFYKYDPQNYHGPLWFYLLQLSEALWGDGIWALRFVPAFLNVLQFVGLGVWCSFRGFQRAWWVLWVWAFSPATVFYSRYAIHESLFVFFMVITFVGVVEYSFFKNMKSIYLIWLGFLGSFLTKETYILILLSFLFSLVISLFFSLLFSFHPKVGLAANVNFQISNRWSILLLNVKSSLGSVLNFFNFNYRAGLFQDRTFFFLFSLFVFFLVFAGWGQYGYGMIDFFKAFLPWMKTGIRGAGHEKPFFYWVNLFYRHEFPTLIVAVLVMSSLFWIHFRKFVIEHRFWILVWSFFACFVFLFFSAIPYKTPWNIVTIQMGFFLAALLIFSIKPTSSKSSISKALRGVLSIGWVLPLISAQSVYKLNYQRPSTMNHDYLYVHTSNEFKKVMDHIDHYVYENPMLWSKEVVIATQESWPLPWYLRNFPRIQYKNFKDGITEDVLFGFVDASKAADFESVSKGQFWKRSFQVRDARENALVYLNHKYFSPLSEKDDLWSSETELPSGGTILPLRQPTSDT